jgi:hypothetical protein
VGVPKVPPPPPMPPNPPMPPGIPPLPPLPPPYGFPHRVRFGPLTGSAHCRHRQGANGWHRPPSEQRCCRVLRLRKRPAWQWGVDRAVSGAALPPGFVWQGRRGRVERHRRPFTLKRSSASSMRMPAPPPPWTRHAKVRCKLHPEELRSDCGGMLQRGTDFDPRSSQRGEIRRHLLGNPRLPGGRPCQTDRLQNEMLDLVVRQS